MDFSSILEVLSIDSIGSNQPISNDTSSDIVAVGSSPDKNPST
jgi:hypothetical protein